MKNDYYFWENYINETIDKLSGLAVQNKDIYADFHIHSDYSADSDQSLEEIIERARKNNFDIISITDHDSVKVYDD